MVLKLKENDINEDGPIIFIMCVLCIRDQNQGSKTKKPTSDMLVLSRKIQTNGQPTRLAKVLSKPEDGSIKSIWCIFGF